MISREIETVSRIITGREKKTKFLEWQGSTEFRCTVMPGETILDCVNRTFEIFGLDTSDLEKIVEGLEDDGEKIIIRYRLEVDSLSLLEFLISEEGKESGLGLTE